MSEHKDLLASVAATCADYRDGDLTAPSPDHVDRWVSQFAKDVRTPLLRELDHVLKNTFFSKRFVSEFFGKQITNKDFSGTDPCAYWRKARLLNKQQHGHSQAEILDLFGQSLKSKCGFLPKDRTDSDGEVVYLDDVLFTGGRVGTDLKAWLNNGAPKKGKVKILVIAAHRLGEWQCLESLKKAAATVKRDIEFECWAAARFENRKAYRDKSEVLWPARIPENEQLKKYMEAEKKFPFEARNAGGKLAIPLFSSEEGRQLLETEFLLAGMKIRSGCASPKAILRPLGFSPFGLGFGSTIVTYRNCPNNSPLALWWGDPTKPKTHPLGKWYPLLPRKTYGEVEGFDDLII